jgi:hypothetical protein
MGCSVEVGAPLRTRQPVARGARRADVWARERRRVNVLWLHGYGDPDHCLIPECSANSGSASACTFVACGGRLAPLQQHGRRLKRCAFFRRRKPSAAHRPADSVRVESVRRKGRGFKADGSGELARSSFWRRAHRSRSLFRPT